MESEDAGSTTESIFDLVLPLTPLPAGSTAVAWQAYCP